MRTKSAHILRLTRGKEIPSSSTKLLLMYCINYFSNCIKSGHCHANCPLTNYGVDCLSS